MSTLINRLQAGEPDVWEDTFACLYPVAFEAARPRLGRSLFHECEDVATETLTALFEAVATVGSEDELKPLVAAIARHKAADRVRRSCAIKRGTGQVESLEEMSEEGELPIANPDHEEMFDGLAVKEMRDLLVELAANVKREYRVVVYDFYVQGLPYAEIARKHDISVGSVGVYIQRGLVAMRTTLARNPHLQAQFLEMVADGALVKNVLPLLSSVQLGGQFLARLHNVKHRAVTVSAVGEVTDDIKLQMAAEVLPASAQPSGATSARLTTELQTRFPAQYEAWTRLNVEREERLAMEKETDARQVRHGRWRMLVTLLLLVGLVIAARYVLFR